MNCLIIEDQIPAQRVLKRYIQDVPHLNLIGCLTDCLSAMDQLNRDKIDLIFLDINLPKISGLNFLRSLRNPPAIIITSAYPEYAIEGFELNVIDYLLKPIAFDRFLKAISKINRAEKYSETSDQKEEPFIFVKSDKVLYRINFSDIIYIQAKGDYVHVITNEKKYFLLQTLKYWKAVLPKKQFVQVHKSFIANLANIDSIMGNQIKTSQGIVPVGRSYKGDLLLKLKTLM